MKKTRILAIVLALASVMAMSGCGDEKKTGKEPTNSQVINVNKGDKTSSDTSADGANNEGTDAEGESQGAGTADTGAENSDTTSGTADTGTENSGTSAGTADTGAQEADGAIQPR